MSLLKLINNKSHFEDRKKLPTIITKRQNFILKNEINTKSQEILEDLTEKSCLTIEIGLENQENKTRDANIQTEI